MNERFRDMRISRIACKTAAWMVMCGSVCAAPEVEEKALPGAEAPPNAAAEVDDLDSAFESIQLLTESIIQIKKRYVEDKTYKDIVNGALHGMLESLDSHSAFMEKDEYEGIQDDTAGKFGGVGVQIGIREGMLVVIAPMEDSPAFKAGLQSGDLILEIDGVKTMRMTMQDAIKRMRGDKGTTVVLTVRSQGDEEPRDVKIVRDEIEVSSVKGARILRDGVGYIRLTQFTVTTAELLEKALVDLTGKGMTGLVLDLRGNSGGLLQSAVDVSRKFLKPGELIVATQGRRGIADRVETLASGGVHYTDIPITVLINRGSASASEIVAGALQDHRRAVLIGERSFGKGSVQSLIPLGADRENALRLTIAYYYTPSGRLIHEKGLDPDIPIDVSFDEWRKVQIRRAQEESPEAFTAEEKAEFAGVEDVVLERAVDLVKAIRIFK